MGDICIRHFRQPVVKDQCMNVNIKDSDCHPHQFYTLFVQLITFKLILDVQSFNESVKTGLRIII